MNTKKQPVQWRPYIAGALLGILAGVSVLASQKLLEKPKYLGTSTTFVRAAGFVEKTRAPEHVEQNAYFKKTKIKVDWQFMLVAGVFVGALVASLLDRSFQVESTPPIWRERFGPSIGLRAIGGVGGGIVAMFGARMAGGCPSGHGLSGLMQLSLSGFVSLTMFFVGGVVVARIVYAGRKVSHE